MTSHEPSHPPLSPEAKKYSTRRDFLLQVGVVINTIAAFMVGVPVIGFVVSSLIKKSPRVWISLGPVSKFPEGATRLAAFQTPYRREVDGPTGTMTCWVRRLPGDKFRILAANCTHLGCPVRWFEQSQLFLCPCHGGAFYGDGERAAGPPPRALYPYEYKIENGELMVKSGVLPTLASPA
jgi:menaquinol-cytochrome c reductase iron-sulfur subunit